MIDGINSTLILFDSSPKRQRYFEHVLEQHSIESKRKKLLGLCRTRWVERHTCYDVFYSMYTMIVEFLQYILDPTLDENTQDDWLWDAQTKIISQGLLTTLMSFLFPVTFACVKAILETVRPLATKLQKRDLDVYEARNLITDRVDRMKEIRVDIGHEFEAWYIDSKELQISFRLKKGPKDMW